MQTYSAVLTTTKDQEALAAEVLEALPAGCEIRDIAEVALGDDGVETYLVKVDVPDTVMLEELIMGAFWHKVEPEPETGMGLAAIV